MRHARRWRRSLLPLILVLLSACSGSSSSGDGTGSITLTHDLTTTLTPTAELQTGVFCRIFYNADRERFSLTVSGHRVGTVEKTVNNMQYRYYEYDRQLNPTGVTGEIVADTRGDYAIASDGTHYYFLLTRQDGYVLTKLDVDFQQVGQVDIAWDINQEAGNDQLMDYTNGKLYLATLYDTQGTGEGYYTGTHSGTTYPHLFVYNTDLTAAMPDRYLMDESNVPSGGSIAVVDGVASIVTTNDMRENKLSVYRWDADWTYLGKQLLAEPGQWSQGLLFEDGRYYVAYHSGLHGRGNVKLLILDQDWAELKSEEVTAYADTYDAQRPWIIKVGNTLYVTYDVATASTTPATELLDWQCHLDVYAISE